MKKIILISFLVVGLFLIGCAKETSDFPPAPSNPGDSSTNDGGALAGQAFGANLENEGYANPRHNFIIVDEKEAYVFGDNLEVKVQNEDLVWPKGMFINKNNQWQEFTFKGQKLADPDGNVWIKGEASMSKTIISDEFSYEVDNAIIAYACSLVDGAWDCHEGNWMAHEFNIQKTGTCNTDADCDSGLCINNKCVEFADAPEDVGLEEAEENIAKKEGENYLIKAHTIQNGENKGYFEINGYGFILSIDNKDQEVLPNGAIVGIDETLIQNYAGGLSGVEFDLVSACDSDFAFNKAHATLSENNENYVAYFDINIGIEEEPFYLNIGEEKILADGSSKIVLKDVISQDWDGGLHGVEFELYCGEEVPQLACEDTDAGTFNPEDPDNNKVKGTTTGLWNNDYSKDNSLPKPLPSEGSITDWCLGEGEIQQGKLLETYCAGDGFASGIVTACQDGSYCNDGACKPCSGEDCPTCHDSADGKQEDPSGGIDAYGTVTGFNQDSVFITKSDDCIDLGGDKFANGEVIVGSSAVLDYSCNDNQVTSIQIICDYGCNGGRCMDEEEANSWLQ